MGCVRYESMKLNNWFRDIVRMGIMIITTKNGDMVDTVQIIEENVYTIDDVKYAVETDMYIAQRFRYEFAILERNSWKFPTRKLAKKRSTIYDSSSST